MLFKLEAQSKYGANDEPFCGSGLDAMWQGLWVVWTLQRWC